MQDHFNSISTITPDILSTNKVIRNTYILLAITILFSALSAIFSMYINLNLPFGIIILGYIGILYLIHATANSVIGLISVFLFTGFMGLTLGPILNIIIDGFSNGIEIVTAALTSTGTIFLGLSSYAMITRKDFSYLNGFLSIGMIVVMLASILGIFFSIPAFDLFISSTVILLMSGFILFETNQIINHGQRNYILATVNLYVSLFNLFVNLLNILSIITGRNDK